MSHLSTNSLRSPRRLARLANACLVITACFLVVGCQPAAPPPATPKASSNPPSGDSSTTRAAPPAKGDESPAPTEAAPTDAAPAEAAPSDTPPTDAAPAEAAPAAEKEPSAAAAGVPAPRVATWAQTQEFIASQKGKVVVLDLWSNFCPPCIAELPQLGKIHDELGPDVVCVALNCNFSGDGSPEDERAAVVEVLNDVKARFTTFICADKDTDLYEKIGIASIPVIQVYGRDGKLAKQFDNEKAEYGPDGFTYAKHIRPFVESLLKP